MQHYMLRFVNSNDFNISESSVDQVSGGRVLNHMKKLSEVVSEWRLERFTQEKIASSIVSPPANAFQVTHPFRVSFLNFFGSRLISQLIPNALKSTRLLISCHCRCFAGQIYFLIILESMTYILVLKA